MLARTFLWYTHAAVDTRLLRAVDAVEKVFTASSTSLRVDTEKRVVTGHGIDLDHFVERRGEDPAPERPVAGPSRVLSIGRLTPSKDPLTVLEALALVRARGRDVVLDLVGGGLTVQASESRSRAEFSPPGGTIPARLQINGHEHSFELDPRTSLLDALRENLGLTGPKKGCNQGACGACTVLADGKRILSCLALAIQYQDRLLTGLSEADRISLDRLIGHLMERASALAMEIANGPSVAIELIKRVTYDGLSRDLDTQIQMEQFLQGITSTTEDVKEGRQSFLERRDPVFKGR